MSGISKVVYGDETLIDISNDTVQPNNLLLGNTAHGSDGNPVVGAVVTHDVIDNLNSTSSEDALSANMGKYLNDNKQGKLPNVVNDRYLHTNASTGALEWSAVQGGGGDLPEYTMAEYEEEKEDIEEGTQFIITDDYMDIGSRYSTFNLTIPSAMVGDTFVVSKGSESHTVVSSSNLVIFYVSGCGTYTITNTTKSQSMEFNAPYFGIYEVSFNVMDFNGWLQAGGIIQTFANLDAVLADEPTIRILMTKHDAVDYLSSWANGDTVSATKILNDNYCAKWINLRDYALDTLYANNTCKTIMDTADKYFYGEWGIVDNSTVPPTWGALGNVPNMTSGNTPYGEVSASTQYQSYYAYLAFNGIDGTYGSATYWAVGQATGWLQYKFINPICAKKVDIGQIFHGDNGADSCTVQGSNDGTNYTDIGTFTLSKTDKTSPNKDTFTLNNNNYYLYYRISANRETGKTYIGLTRVQFYGRELKVSVPIMTSNTTPYGEASAKSVQSSNFPAWKAFNGNANGETSTWASATNDATAWIQYHFTKPICVKMVYLQNRIFTGDTNCRILTFKVQASNDGSNWTDITDTIGRGTGASNSGYASSHEIANNNSYEYYRIQPITSTSTIPGVAILQFYGLDYSEHDERHYIYDHGIEVEAIEGSVSSGNIFEKRPRDLYINKANSASAYNIYAFAVISNSINFTPYSLSRIKVDHYGNLFGASIKNHKHGEYIAGENLATIDFNTPKPEFFMDLTNVNVTAWFGIGTNYQHETTYAYVSEWWLE